MIKHCQDESLTFRSESSASATGQYLHLKVFLLRGLIVLGNRLVGGKPTIADLSPVRYNEYAVKETISTLPITSQNRGIGQRAHGNISNFSIYILPDSVRYIGVQRDPYVNDLSKIYPTERLNVVPRETSRVFDRLTNISFGAS